MSSQINKDIYTLTIIPAILECVDPPCKPLKRTNYGTTQTVLTYDNFYSAEKTRKTFHADGYTIHIEK